MGNKQNVVCERHLESLAAAVSAQVATLSGGGASSTVVSGNVLSTVPSTVDGGMCHIGAANSASFILGSRTDSPQTVVLPVYKSYAIAPAFKV